MAYLAMWTWEGLLRMPHSKAVISETISLADFSRGILPHNL